MIGGHGMDGACGHIKGFDSPDSHIKGNLVLGRTLVGMAVYDYYIQHPHVY